VTLIYDDSSMTQQTDEAGADVIPASSAPSSSRVRSVLLVAVVVLGLAAMVLGILAVRRAGPFAESAAASASGGVPESAAVESQYGVRLVGVDITASGGMIQLRYQVLDLDKSAALHPSADEAPVVVVVDADGHEYADPGIAGHTHVAGVAAAGGYDRILLANARGGVHAGDRVTVRFGDLELSGVPVD
jgi:hypothetical protein